MAVIGSSNERSQGTRRKRRAPEARRWAHCLGQDPGPAMSRGLTSLRGTALGRRE